MRRCTESPTYLTNLLFLKKFSIGNFNEPGNRVQTATFPKQLHAKSLKHLLCLSFTIEWKYHHYLLCSLHSQFRLTAPKCSFGSKFSFQCCYLHPSNFPSTQQSSVDLWLVSALHFRPGTTFPFCCSTNQHVYLQIRPKQSCKFAIVLHHQKKKTASKDPSINIPNSNIVAWTRQTVDSIFFTTNLRFYNFGEFVPGPQHDGMNSGAEEDELGGGQQQINLAPFFSPSPSSSSSWSVMCVSFSLSLSRMGIVSQK